MPEMFIVTPVAAGETSVPDGLAINAPDREPLLRALRKAGLTVIATNSTFNPRIPRSEDLNARFWGPAPDSKTLANAVFTNLQEQFALRRRLAAESIGRDEAAQRLGVTARRIIGGLSAHTCRCESGTANGVCHYGNSTPLSPASARSRRPAVGVPGGVVSCRSGCSVNNPTSTAAHPVPKWCSTAAGPSW